MLSFEDYEFGNELGKSQFIVYEATNITNKKKYAIKLIEISANDKDEEKTILSEAIIHSKISHLASVVPFVGLCREEYMNSIPKKKMLRFGLVMEKMQNSLEGLILEQNEKKTFFKIEEIQKFVKDTYEGFMALQNLTIAHRDIKPSNILIDEKGDYKIADVGSAKLFFSSLKSKTILGTPHFFSPELMKSYLENNEHCQYDLSCSDVFSYGLTLLRMATLEKIVGLNLIENSANKKKIIGSLEQIYGDRSKELIILLKKLLKYDQKKRKDFITNREIAEKFYNLKKNEKILVKNEAFEEKIFFEKLPNEEKKNLEKLPNELDEIVLTMMTILDIEINPHLNEKHKEIYIKYVAGWVWLYSKKEDWKWWWWAKNAWWNNKECGKCMKLWKLYEKEIDNLDKRRREILQNEWKLEDIITFMKKILDQEINPHLKKKHNDIFINYVDDWDWLNYDKKDWKWWWWADNLWWKGQECQKCMKLWHKSEIELDSLDEMRRKKILEKKK